MLEYVAASFRVVRHVRPKLSCARCERIVQSEAPSRPIARDLAGPGLLAPVLVAKYADHLPLYRQSAIEAREGVELERSTLADWIGSASALLQPLVRGAGQGDAEGGQAAYRRHACPGTGAGPWHDQDRPAMDAHDDRPAGDGCPPSVLFRYSSDRKGERPQDHLRTFRGFLQADGYAGYNRLYGNEIVEVACWAHMRRKFHDVYVRRCARLVLAPGSRGYDNGSTRPCAGYRADPISPPPSATPARAGISAAAIATMAAWRSTTALPSGRYGVWRPAGRTGCSPDPTPADSEPPRSTAWSKPARSTLSTPKPTCATCSASSQIIPSIASPSSYLGTLVTSLPGPENSGPPADAYGSTAAQAAATP
jgi:transposase